MTAANQIRITTLLALIAALTGSILPAVIRKKKLNWCLLAVSAAGVLYFTVLAKTPAERRTFNLMLFWNYGNWSLIEVRHEIIQNVLLFMPYGAALCAVGAKYPVGIAALTSLSVELTQYFFRLGLCEADDVMHNTLGAALGVLLFKIVCDYMRRKERERNRLQRKNRAKQPQPQNSRRRK